MTSSSILVIGGTGMLGQHLVTASINAGHPTAVLVRPATAADPGKAKLLEDLRTSGANIVHGDINDHERLVAAIRNADAVISAVGHSSPEEVKSQLKIMAAIQEAGNVKRFLPSEYGCDVELAEQMLEPARSILGAKLGVREALRVSGIPHTIICGFWLHGFLLPKAGDPEADSPPTTKVTTFGEGKRQAMFVNEKDMITLAIKAVEDPRTLDKILYVRPPGNLCSLDQIVALWETKIDKSLERCYVSEEEMKTKIRASPFPLNFQLAMVHWTLVARASPPAWTQIAVDDDASSAVEATQLYPEMKFLTVDEYLHSPCMAGLPPR